MQLRTLLEALPTCKMPAEGTWQEISSLTDDSRRAAPGSLFLALRGAEQDGHHFVKEAYARGCRAFLCEYAVALPSDAAVAYVPNSRYAAALVAAAFYGNTGAHPVLIGITGTKGKTTTALMLYHLLEKMGVRVGYIGSGGARYGAMTEKTENTTPAAPVLHRLLAAMRRAHVRVVVVEVSSQALATERVAGLHFPICLFTNLAPDHIGAGEHPDLTHYRAAKARLFSEHGCHTVIVNADDEASAYMAACAGAARVLRVSCRGAAGACLCATRMRLVETERFYGSSFLLQTEKEGEVPVALALPGECNINNALLALCAAETYAKEYSPATPAAFRTLAPHLAALPIPGRFEPVKTAQVGVHYLIDYAHNGYSLRAALVALRAYGPGRLVCLFGSVGARTYSRRTELGEAACLADFCIVTTDDPGTEAPEDTMREICRVLEEHGRDYVAIADRAEAIRYAVAHAQRGDLILLAGKGHEEYQLVGQTRLPFSERRILQEAAACCPVY